MRIAAAATAMVASALALLDCSGGGGSASKAGGAGGPVTLRLATDDEPTSPPALQAKEFARRVNERSRGRLRVEVVTDAVKPDSDYERLLVKTVTSGTLDLGLFESRSWDRVGVTSLNALEAPFLVTTDALVAAVIGGGEGRDMLAGLERAGVVGLALLPDVLEHPFGPDRPLLGPDDYAGGVIPGTKTRPYTTVLGALGATVEQGQGLDRRRHIGGVGGYNQQGSGIFTGNVTFFPKTNALAINARAYERLDADARSVLSEAAAATRDWAIATTPTDPERARSYCTRNDATGRAIALASRSDVAALQAAVAPVYAEFERDAATKRMIARIRALKGRVGNEPGPPAPCRDKEAVIVSDAARPTAALDGVYRFDVTAAELRAVGVAATEAIDAFEGVYTFTLAGGEYCFEQISPKPQSPNPYFVPGDCGTYAVDGKRFFLNFAAGGPAEWRWGRTGDGALEFAVVRSGSGSWAPKDVSRVYVAEPWKRIGDAPADRSQWRGAQRDARDSH